MLWIAALLGFAALAWVYCMAIEACFLAAAHTRWTGVAGLALLAALPIVRPSPSAWMVGAGYGGPSAGLILGGVLAFVLGGLGAWIAHRRGVTRALARRIGPTSESA